MLVDVRNDLAQLDAKHLHRITIITITLITKRTRCYVYKTPACDDRCCATVFCRTLNAYGILAAKLLYTVTRCQRLAHTAQSLRPAATAITRRSDLSIENLFRHSTNWLDARTAVGVIQKIPTCVDTAIRWRLPKQLSNDLNSFTLIRRRTAWMMDV